MSEREWQNKVREVCELYGWLTYHTHDSRRSDAGFPDLVMVKGDRVVYAELKKETGKATAKQKEWLEALSAAGQEVALWRPSDLPTVLRVLGPRRERATYVA
jgi:hypothetical protein